MNIYDTLNITVGFETMPNGKPTNERPHVLDAHRKKTLHRTTGGHPHDIGQCSLLPIEGGMRCYRRTAESVHSCCCVRTMQLNKKGSE